MQNQTISFRELQNSRRIKMGNGGIIKLITNFSFNKGLKMKWLWEEILK